MRTFSPALARDLAALGRVNEGTSIESVLRSVTAAVAVGVPGCAGGTVELRREDRLTLSASHSDLIALVDREQVLGEGPSVEALATGRNVLVRDVLLDGRWPRYAATAVRHGVRSALMLPITIEGSTLLLGLYAVRPGAFAGGSSDALASLLGEHLAVALANISDYDDVLTDAAQMQEALAGRSVIDQAKGIIMHASGCSAEAAFDELRRLSQHHQVKVADLARRLVSEHQAKHGGAVPSP
ncbi:GAF and ANTAR domain-containing protein [Sphaerisporangium sp. TRM90804]|uniref:GAF and ANTAR domain-containing protein n=1 Tax=Sphaerisporangium sp. TRM90804 TaxID=3031113 RepID=UPI00244D24A0|nr:GAF and ANTAR domain-containing protein [Sphaerisporangium sp. TRM90804]MDH2428469.1 GAF and ANTAR domain-containing protein [Sphaerisporangium sp. TRM90804]